MTDITKFKSIAVKIDPYRKAKTIADENYMSVGAFVNYLIDKEHNEYEEGRQVQTNMVRNLGKMRSFFFNDSKTEIRNKMLKAALDKQVIEDFAGCGGSCSASGRGCEVCKYLDYCDCSDPTCRYDEDGGLYGDCLDSRGSYLNNTGGGSLKWYIWVIIVVFWLLSLYISFGPCGPDELRFDKPQHIFRMLLKIVFLLLFGGVYVIWKGFHWICYGRWGTNCKW